jgi:hypothetical protein
VFAHCSLPKGIAEHSETKEWLLIFERDRQREAYSKCRQNFASARIVAAAASMTGSADQWASDEAMIAPTANTQIAPTRCPNGKRSANVPRHSPDAPTGTTPISAPRTTSDTRYSILDAREARRGGCYRSDVLDTLNSNWHGGYFQASDVARLINEPMAGEDAQAAALRSFFEPAARLQTQVVTAKSIGKRLVPISDAPVWVGDRTMKLVRDKPHGVGPQKRATWFKVDTS